MAGANQRATPYSFISAATATPSFLARGGVPCLGHKGLAGPCGAEMPVVVAVCLGGGVHYACQQAALAEGDGLGEILGGEEILTGIGGAQGQIQTLRAIGHYHIVNAFFQQRGGG